MWWGRYKQGNRISPSTSEMLEENGDWELGFSVGITGTHFLHQSSLSLKQHGHQGFLQQIHRAWIQHAPTNGVCHYVAIGREGDHDKRDGYFGGMEPSMPRPEPVILTPWLHNLPPLVNGKSARLSAPYPFSSQTNEVKPHVITPIFLQSHHFSLANLQPSFRVSSQSAASPSQHSKLGRPIASWALVSS